MLIFNKRNSISIKENFQNDKVASQHNSKNRILVQEIETHFSRVSDTAINFRCQS